MTQPRSDVGDCRPLVDCLLAGISETGLMKLLDDFAGANPGPLGETVRSWHDNMVAGQSLQEALRRAKPGLALPVEELLALSLEQGVLDRALADLDAILRVNGGEEQRRQELSRLLNSFRDREAGGIVCDECLRRELEKVLRRARLEQAYEVILTQEGESFFHQKYLGVKAIHLIEPCHSRLYKSFLARLKQCAADRTALVLDSGEYAVSESRGGKFQLRRDGDQLWLTFP